MSSHVSAAMLKVPDDARLDAADLYVLALPERADRTVMIFDVNPFMTGADFLPDAVYRINVDNDGDLQADVAFSSSSPSRAAAPRPARCTSNGQRGPRA